MLAASPPPDQDFSKKSRVWRFAHNILLLAGAVVGLPLRYAWKPSSPVLLQRLAMSSKSKAAAAPALISVKAERIRLLTDLQVAIQFGGPSPVATEAIHGVLSSGGYRKHLDQVHRRLDAERRAVATRLGPLGIRPVLMPRGGPYLWCRMPEGISSTVLAQSALPQGVVLAPGNVFSPSLSADGFMRFNVAHMDDARPFRVLERALKAME